MTDTDSLLYDIRTNDVYEDIKENLSLFDTSEYPITHPCYSLVDKKRLGTFKDETHAKPILEFVGLCAKCYSLLVLQDVDKKEKRVAKGVPRVAINKHLKHYDFKDCLFTTNNQQKYTFAQIVRSENHFLYLSLIHI